MQPSFSQVPQPNPLTSSALRTNTSISCCFNLVAIFPYCLIRHQAAINQVATGQIDIKQIAIFAPCHSYRRAAHTYTKLIPSRTFSAIPPRRTKLRALQNKLLSPQVALHTSCFKVAPPRLEHRLHTRIWYVRPGANSEPDTPPLDGLAFTLQYNSRHSNINQALFKPGTSQDALHMQASKPRIA